ncbi:unnamed protein product [Amoebophrya sp. A25]|nr:unnamed protein product [Amoebophrya sp. A25]|eukprot:GSA25T00011196001.1
MRIPDSSRSLLVRCVLFCPSILSCLFASIRQTSPISSCPSSLGPGAGPIVLALADDTPATGRVQLPEHFEYSTGDLSPDLIGGKPLRPRNIMNMIPKKMGVPLAFGWQAGFDVDFPNRPQVVYHPCVHLGTCLEKEPWSAELKPFKRSAYSRPVR